MRKFSVIIPHFNEGDELIRTVRSVRIMSANDVDVIVVDDCSDDGRDYESELKKYDVIYKKLDERTGVAGARDVGVEMCRTPYVLILDAHCRILTQDWDLIAEQVLNDEPNGVYCCKTRMLIPPNKAKLDRFSAGAVSRGKVDYVTSITRDWSGDNLTQDVPCIIGANYIFAKDWWNRIGGLAELTGTWGCDEALLSVKTYRAGGVIRCITKVETAHWYKKTADRTFKVTWDGLRINSDAVKSLDGFDSWMNYNQNFKTP